MDISIRILILPLAFIILSSFASLGCKSSDGLSNKKNNAGSNPYFPVKDNSKWQYINEGPRDETELFSVNIKSVKEDGSDIIAVFDSFPFFMKQNEQTTLRIKSNGEVYILDKDLKENLFLPEPSKYQPNYTWQYGEWTAYIAQTDETVVTEKGTYEHCLSIGFSLGGITYSSVMWLSKDTGIVKWSSNRTNPPTLKPIYYVLK